MGLVVKGLPELQAKLESMKRGAQRRVIRPALNAATKPLVETAKSAVPVETGLLRKSLTRKLKSYTSGMIVAVIGPKKDAKSTKKIGRGAKARTVSRVPVRYAHLVEFGTYRSRGKPFLKVAYDRAKSEAPGTFARVAWEKIRTMATAGK